MKIILASTSPRRKTLLSQFKIDFETVSPAYDEEFETLDFTFEKIEQISKNKALSIYDKVDKNSIIISADTVVVFENKILLKPKTKDVAFDMLKKLSGQKHFVVTAYTLLCPATGKMITDHVKTEVSFAKLTDEQNLDYINNYNPVDKAGAYGLQELPDYFKPTVNGSKNNVIGLPVEEIIEDLNYHFLKIKNAAKIIKTNPTI